MLMKISFAIAAILLAVAALEPSASAAESRYLWPKTRRAPMVNWHANYAHSAYGQPVALVVPPTAQLQTNSSGNATQKFVLPNDAALIGAKGFAQWVNQDDRSGNLQLIGGGAATAGAEVLLGR